MNISESFVASRFKLSLGERLALEREHGRAQLAERSPELNRLLWNKRLEVVCPDCGEHQAASHYCYRCFLPLLTTDWYDRTKKVDK